MMTFFREWLPLTKSDFRILTMLADKGLLGVVRELDLLELLQTLSICLFNLHPLHVVNAIDSHLFAMRVCQPHHLWKQTQSLARTKFQAK